MLQQFGVLAFLLLSIMHLCFAAPTVVTDCGPVVGGQDTEHGVDFFKGIPYAQAERWNPPTLLKDANQCWSGTLQASEFGAQCPQYGYLNLLSGSENCHFLNIWRPSNASSSDRLPVFFYMHGGSSVEGSGADPYADGTNFTANQDAIVVSINFRLNAFGFLSLRVLSENSPTGASGNYGIMDCIAALQWVQHNIAAFGGDPKNVVIYGQSSGGTNVYALMISPAAKNLFHRAIAMSGSPRIDELRAQAEQDNDVYIDRAGCRRSTDAQILACLRSLTTEQALEASPMDVFPNWNPPWGFGLPNPKEYLGGLVIVDGSVVPLPILDAFSTPEATADVPLVISHMAQEIDLWPDLQFTKSATADDFHQMLFSNLTFLSPDLPSQLAQLYQLSDYSNSVQEAYETVVNDVRVFCGSIDIANVAISLSGNRKSPVYHTLQVQAPTEPLLFDALAGWNPTHPFHLWDLISLNEAYLPLYPTQQADKQYRSLLQSTYGYFARQGEMPSTWTPYTYQKPTTAYMSASGIENVANARAEFCDLWNSYGLVQKYSWNN